jgi:hypothetical protein
MIEAAIVFGAFVIGLAIAATILPRGGNARMGIAPIRSGFSIGDRFSRLPYYPLPIPEDATHIAWVMMGQGADGVVYSLAVQDLDAAKSEVRQSKHSHDPVITQMMMLEADLNSRGCQSTSDLRFCLARVDDDGNEHWWSGSKWVRRWHRDAALFDVWGERA